jgi:hypothetical protein
VYWFVVWEGIITKEQQATVSTLPELTELTSSEFTDVIKSCKLAGGKGVATRSNKFLTSLNIEKFEFVPRSIYGIDHWILQIGLKSKGFYMDTTARMSKSFVK